MMESGTVADDEDVGALQRKWGAKREKATASPAPDDGQGRAVGPLRNRLSLRVSDEVAVGLGLIALLRGGSQNKFCETALEAAVQKAMAELKGEMTGDEWDVLVRVIKRGRGSGGARSGGGRGTP